MKTKLFEVRDKGTFVPMIAIQLSAQNEAEQYLLSRAGFGEADNPEKYVMLGGLEGHGPFTYDPYEQPNRTRQVAHQHIIDHFDELENGQVIDVQYILGETSEPKKSERL